MPDVGIATAWQIGVLWLAKGPDRNGQIAVSSTPVEFNWKLNKNRAERIDPNGNKVSVDCTAGLGNLLGNPPTPLINVPVGSLMWMGRLTDLPAGNNYFGQLNELLQVKTYGESPDVKGRYSTRTVGLMRLKDSYPSMV